MTDILILGEVSRKDGPAKLDSTVAELVTAAGQIGGDIGVVLLGTRLDDAAKAAGALGASKVYTVDDAVLDDHSLDPKVAAYTAACEQVKPRVVLLARTLDGRDVGPRVAFRLGAGLAQDCVKVGVDASTGRVVATRPVYGGNAVATVTFPEADPQMVVVRAKVYAVAQPDASRAVEVVPVTVDLGNSVGRVKSVKNVIQSSQGVRLEDARVVVAGGRGLGGPEPFKMVEELAKLMGGAMGASRAACDAGWVDHSYQVGLTGKAVAPEVYIAVGISGASQHMAGLSGVKHIVAINSDKEANILKEASYAVVGDWSKVLPSFIETVRELVKS